MLPGWGLFLVALAYLTCLFGIAWWAERRAVHGRALARFPLVYALSIAVYCTSWTFYGSVGRASETGLGFLPVYLGPTLAFSFGWLALRRMVAAAKRQRITSIADFIAARYGKSQTLGALVTLIAVVGTVPYIALQLKAVAASVATLSSAPGDPSGAFGDTPLIVAGALAAFAVLFGTRHIDATEHHEGVVVAVAFESLIKLFAFLAVGVFVVWGLHEGPASLIAMADAMPALSRLLHFDAAAPDWVTLTVLSAAAALCLPRQFQVTVVGCLDEDHLRTAAWAFPLYLLVINVFVLPIALAGLLAFPDGSVAPDSFVLALPVAGNANSLAMLAFLGGLSAATAMVIVSTIALGGMICNDVVMPLLLRVAPTFLANLSDVTRLLLLIRRVAMIGVLALGYTYFRVLDGAYALVSIGLVSFAAAAQFAPALLGAVFWRGGTRKGAVAGLSGGFAVWLWTLFLPSFAKDTGAADWLFALDLANPYALGGLAMGDPITHALFWSWLVNVGLFVAVSLLDTPSALEKTQAILFVEALNHREEEGGYVQGSARIGALRDLAMRYVGREPALEAFQARNATDPGAMADAATIRMTERLIAGAIGAASARVAVASAVRRDGASGQELLDFLDETTHVLEYSRQLEAKSAALEQASAELRAANERLTELDRMKDEFLSTVSHELRTPLTSIRAFSELLRDEPDMEADQRGEFLDIIIAESERLTRLINQVLDIAKMESGRMVWAEAPVDLAAVVRDAAASVKGLFDDGTKLTVTVPNHPARLVGDRDRLHQVVVNLVSNARKFADTAHGEVTVTLSDATGGWLLTVTDNGAGIPEAQRRLIFDRFHQAGNADGGNPTGTGLGLSITRAIVEHHGGSIVAEEAPGGGAALQVRLPVSAEAKAAE